VISERNDPAVQSLGKMWDWLRRRIYRYADVITANSRGVLKTLANFVPPSKLAYVPNVMAIPSEDDSQVFDAPTILAIGRLHPQKAYDVLLDAFALLVSQAPEWRLSCIGEGPLQEALQRQAERLNIAKQVTWHGRIGNPFAYYRSAEIFVMPSRYEGTPNALLEAMSCGLPVVVSDAASGPLEYVENEVSGLVVPVNHPQALAEALLRLIAAPDLRQRLGQAAHERIAECETVAALPAWEQVIGLV
jgi:GalNAc-alpha-(1->4)-GalNAc-alpha-(1->3)-diNAcBac-PP-undecaprenol alpha-1,4-N-acetyl-D-galactosaminyltransferase